MVEGVSIATVAGWIVAGVTAIVAVYVGSKRGVDQVDERADTETRRLVEAQAARLLLLERSNQEQAAEIGALKSKVATLEAELRMERAITRRMREEGT
jgi:hypothetical protein